ncbi:MAG TPA: DUF488 family protein [Candidatus Udaeobacter sp.]|jgi:hypothetical protein|nr:DUF488 family protein [Candidatus Udaeobacter sp.]
MKAFGQSISRDFGGLPKQLIEQMPKLKPTVVLTIGHSTRTLDEFIGLLQAHAVSRVVDVRTVPRSRHNPQFNHDFTARFIEES